MGVQPYSYTPAVDCVASLWGGVRATSAKGLSLPFHLLAILEECLLVLDGCLRALLGEGARSRGWSVWTYHWLRDIPLA